jgi:hypothetical protein
MLEDILSEKKLVYQYKEPKSTARDAQIKRREEIVAQYGWQPEVEQEFPKTKQEIEKE